MSACQLRQVKSNGGENKTNLIFLFDLNCDYISIESPIDCTRMRLLRLYFTLFTRFLLSLFWSFVC